MVVKPKYRNAATGETWTGRGKPPKWIAGQDRNQYLIENNPQ
jgi:DNA-binding protein H-NS